MYSLSYEFIEELAEQILIDYFGTPRFPLKKIDVDAFARDYLGLDVQYDRLCYGGETVLAVTAYKDVHIGLPESNPVVYRSVPENTILLDHALSEPQRAAQRAFTIAHECGHHAIAMLEPDTDTSGKSIKKYCGTEAERKWMWEWQANTFASTLLMPKYLIECMQIIMQHPQKFVIFGDQNVLPDEKQQLLKLAQMLGVSYSALLYRLKKIDLVEKYSYEEYLYAADAEREKEGSPYGPFFNRGSVFYQGPQGARPVTQGIIILRD